jgi:NAD(P)-dependent dehydrogenase (short-subunit alcohol dehydrogenase family)
VVTGAGKGLGRAYALWLAARGAAVVVNNRVHSGIPSSAHAVAEEIRTAGGQATADEHDISIEAGAAELIKAAYRQFGRLDILICNAAITTPSSAFHELSLNDIRRTMDVNLWGTIYPLYAALPGLIKAGYGRIVLTTSTAGLFGIKGGAAYGASKAAMIGLSRSIARDIPDGCDVRINLVSPAAYTPMSSKDLGEQYADFLSPMKVAPVVGWLASEQCSHSGLILHAGAGRVSRVRVVEGIPIDIVDEDVARLWPVLDQDLPAQEFTNSFGSGAALMPELASADSGYSSRR